MLIRTSRYIWTLAAAGAVLLSMAQVEPRWNFLGLEIRQPLVHEANTWRQELRLTNLHYLFCNVNNSLRSLLSSLPKGRCSVSQSSFLILGSKIVTPNGGWCNRN
jgi:hypothetical protein